MKLPQKIRVLTVTVVTLGLGVGGVLTAELANPPASLGATVTSAATSHPASMTPDLAYWCEGNLCMGWKGSAPNPDIAFHADEYSFYGHYELVTPEGKVHNSSERFNGTGPGSDVYVPSDNGGSGEYCGTAWEANGEGGWTNIGHVCVDIS